MFSRWVDPVLGLGFPLLVFVGLYFWGVVTVGWIALVFGVVRLWLWALTEHGRPRFEVLGWLLLAIGIIILISETAVAAKLYPFMVNAAALAYFTWTLVFPPSAVERIARTMDPALPDHAVRYTRRVTLVWCGFFAMNGAVALYTAFGTSIEIWALYNGFVAYVLMALLFGAEYLIRRRTQLASRTGNG